MASFTNLLMKAPDATSKQLEKLSIVSNSGENLLNLINNVLDISKIEAGHIVRENADVNLKRLLHEIESLMHDHNVVSGMSVIAMAELVEEYAGKLPDKVQGSGRGRPQEIDEAS